jgi:hypothetical protein
MKTRTNSMPHIFRKSLFCLTGILVGSISALAQSSRPVYEIHQTSQPPVIDGKIDDGCWQDVPVLTNFTQVLPVEGAVPTEQTEVRFIYNADYLFIAVRCFDSEPDKIIAKQMQHDDWLGSDDMVKIAFDTFFRQHDGYFFAVNPLGARTEGLIENFTEENSLWDTVWQTRSRIDEQGWTAEIAIPFKSLSFDPKNDMWGFNIERVIRRKQETVRWTAISNTKSVTSLADFGELRGLTGIRQGLGLEIKPYVSGKYRVDAVDNQKDMEFKFGSDLTYNITPSLKANATFNTDFAEAEVDERTVNLSRFPEFFPEKRDFFLQDSSLFSFGGLEEELLPYYSRRIGLAENGRPVDIIAGGRLTGRTGDTSFALLSVQQDKYQDIQSKNLFVGRVSTRISEQSEVGLIATSGDPLSNSNNKLVGFDFNYLNNHLPNDKQLVGHAWFMGTSSGQIGGKGTAFGGNLDYPNEPLDMDVSFQQIGTKFHPALGFVERQGVRDFAGSATYIWRPNTELIRSISLGARPSFTTDLDNRLVTENHDLPTLTFTTPADDQLTLEYTLCRDVLDEPYEIHPGIVIPAGNYRYGQFKPSFETSEARPVSAGFRYRSGKFYDGTERDYEGSLDWRPTRFVTTGVSYELREIKLKEGDFNVRIASARLNLAFTPDLSWNTIVQYDNISGEMGLNSRLRWTYRPGCDLFVVVNQGWGFDEWRFNPLGTELTVKVGATFRF